ASRRKTNARKSSPTSRPCTEDGHGDRRSGERHALQRDSMHQTTFAVIVVDGEVPGRAIVPEGDRTLAPLEAGVELRLRGVGIEIAEQGPAFIFGPALETRREGRIHVER